MSNTVTSLAKRRIVGSSARKAVLMYMADNASDDGKGIWTSKRNMALDLEMSRRTVQSHIQTMMESGLVIEVGQRKCANGYTVEYGIDLDALMRMPCTRAGDAPVQEMHHYPRKRCTGTRAGDAPKPPLEPPLEPPIDIGAPAKAEPVAKKARRAVAIPENWVPNAANIAHAISKKFSDEEIENEAEKFRDYHLARGTTFKDWDAGWRTWIANAIKFGGERVATRKIPSRPENRSDPAVDQILRLAGLGEASGNGGS